MDDATPNSDLRDPVVTLLKRLAASFGVAVNEKALTQSIALQNGRVPIEHIHDVAGRASLSLEEIDPQAISDNGQYCPMLLLGQADPYAAIVEDVVVHGKDQLCELALPDGTTAQLPCGRLAQIESVRLFRIGLVKPEDSRTASLPSTARAHWFWNALKLNTGIYGHAAAATLVINLLALSVPLVVMNIYDRVVANAAFTTLWSLAAGAVLAAVIDFVLKSLRGIMIDKASARSDVTMANRLFGMLVGARLAGRGGSVGVQSNTLREFESLREFFNAATLCAIGDLPFVILFLAVIYLVAGPLVVVPALAIPIIVVCGLIAHGRLTRLIEESFRDAAMKNAVVVETLTGLETIKALAAEGWAAATWERAVASQLRHGLKSRALMAMSVHLVGFAQTACTVSILVYGVYLVTAGQITPGAMFAATILCGRCMQPLAQIAGLLTRLHQARMSFNALQQIAALPQERPHGRQFLQPAALEGAISFEDVRFAYGESETAALSNIDIDISPGERVGVIGGIGSGKSTLLKLAMGLFPPERGRVSVDGMSVADIDPAILRGSIGAVLQDTTLFHATLRENLTMHAPGASDEEILAALAISGADQWIKRLSTGLETMIGERGAGLSGGQRQTLALARALVHRPTTLLLDEPTSDMDGSTEQNFVAGLKHQLAGRTLIAVTHKPAVLALVDRLIVMEHGRVLIDGPRQQVLDQLKQITVERRASVDRRKAS